MAKQQVWKWFYELKSALAESVEATQIMCSAIFTPVGTERRRKVKLPIE